MTIKKCDKCGAEIRERPETNAVFPKYYIYKYSSWATKEDIDLCQDCVKKFDEWLEYKDDDEEVEKLKEKISKLEAENIRLRDQIKLNETQQNNQCMLVESEMKYYEKQKHWYRGLNKKLFEKIFKVNNMDTLQED